MQNNTSVLSQFLDFFQTTNKQNFFIRVGQVFVLIMQIFLYNQQEALVTVWKESRMENVFLTIKKERELEYPNIVKEQVQISYQVVRPDIVLVYEYVPIAKNSFARLVDYEGQLPENLQPEQLKGIPIIKTSKEYIDHLIGRNFKGKSEERALLLKNYDFKDIVNIAYSCPIYNLDNIYTGSMLFLWYHSSDKKIADEETLETQCLASTRILGRSK